jgi:3-hydroxyisobutyrate dehydrogenase-like beta-hydroxyacid dehydrogenase
MGEHGAFETLAKGAVFIDHTTASATVARELAAVCAGRDTYFLDAPVSGGQAGAENGALTVMVGGDPERFERVRPVIDSYARKTEWMGQVGNGQLAKMVNQICIAGLLQGLSEGINFARHAGLDIERLLDVISKGAAQSWQMENRGITMHRDEFDFGFAVDWMRKDLGMCLDEARRNGSLLPVTALINEFYGKVQAVGGGRWDTSSLIRLLRDA